MVKTLALIGAGRWGKNLARNFHALGALHTICDANESLLDALQSQYQDVALTSNYHSVLENPHIKQVAIASPAEMHYTLAKQAILAGKDVYVEKPLCLDSSQGRELIALAEERGAILMVGHLLQYHPYVRKLQEMVREGALGKLQYIVSNRMNLGAIRTEENALWSFAPHDISVILSLCGDALPESLRCTGAAYLSQKVADTTLTTLKFAGGVRAHIYVNWMNPFKEQKLVVIGSGGMAVFDDMQPWDKKLIVYQEPVVWVNGNIPKENKTEGEYIVVPQEEPLCNECAHFLESCSKRTLPRTNGNEGLRVLQVLQAAQESLNQDGELKALQPFVSNTNYFAHETAVVSPKAEIGAGTKVWHFSHVMDGAVLGERCNIGQNVVVSPGVRLGAGVKVQNNVSVYTGVICEDDVFLGPSMVFTNVNNPRSSVCRRGDYAATFVRKGASIGANATIVCGHELGAYCFVGAGAVVTRDVKPYALVVGNPAKQIGWISKHGERLDLPVELESGQTKAASCPVTGEEYTLEGDRLFCKTSHLETVSV